MLSQAHRQQQEAETLASSGSPRPLSSSGHVVDDDRASVFSRRSSKLDLDETQDIIRDDSIIQNGETVHPSLQGAFPVVDSYTVPLANGAQPSLQTSSQQMLRASAEEDVPASMALIPLRRSALTTHLQAAKIRLADYDGRLFPPSQPLSHPEVTRYIEDLRLRLMARKGTKPDLIFKRGEKFVEGWFEFVPVLSVWESSAQDCSDVLMTFCKVLLRHTLRGSTLVLEKILNTLQLIGSTLLDEVSTTKRENLMTTQVSRIVIDMVVLIVELICYLLNFLKTSNTGDQSSQLSLRLSTFRHRWSLLRSDLKLEIWRQEVERGGSGSEGVRIDTLRAWLASIEAGSRPGPSEPVAPPFEDVPLDWLRSLVARFRRSDKYMLVMTGEPGVGKSSLMASIHELLKLSESLSITALTFEIEPLSRTKRSGINLVKYLLLQLFDRSIGDMAFFTRLCEAYIDVERRRIAEPEELLWNVFREYVLKRPDEVYVLIDGLDKIEGGISVALRIRTILYDICSRRRTLKSVILSQPIFKDFPAGCEHFVIDSSIIHKDLHYYLRKRIQGSVKLRYLTPKEVNEILRYFADRSLSTFLEVNLFVRWLELHRNFDEILRSLRHLPKTLKDLIDHLILRTDFKKHEVKALLSWLLVSEKIMTAHELRLFLGPDIQLPSEPPDSEAIYLQGLCPALLDIRGVNVHFVHPLVKERLLDLASKWKIPLHTTDAHANALVSCISYIKQQFGAAADSLPTWDDSENSVNKELKRQVSADTLLEYSIHYYIVHYERSKLNSDRLRTMLSVDFVDSVDLAICERFYWRSQAYDRVLEDLHNRALHLRITILGRNSRSVIQTLITVAQLKYRGGDVVAALKFIGEAWEASQLFAPDLSVIAKTLAEKYYEIYEQLEGSDDDLHSSITLESILHYLWKADEVEFGPTDYRTLQRVDVLKRLLVAQGRHQQLIELLKHLYDVFAADHFNLKAIDYVDELISLYIELGRFNDVKRLCEEVLTSMGDTLLRWDSRRLKIVLRLVEYHEIAGRRDLAIERLRSEWNFIIGQLGSMDDSAVIICLLKLTTRMITINGTTGIIDDLNDVVGKSWTMIEPRLSKYREVMVLSRVLAQACIRYGRHKTGLPILESLMGLYLNTLSENYEEAVQVALTLATCYQSLGRPFSEVETTYLKLLRLFLTIDLRHSVCITLALALINYYQTVSRLSEAMSICCEVLPLFWSQVMNIDGPTTGLPEGERDNILNLAFKYAFLTSTQESELAAVKIYRYIWESCLKSLAITHIQLFNAAKELSSIYLRVQEHTQAIDLWKNFRAMCIAQLGAVHALVHKVTEQLVLLYEQYEFPESEEILLDIIHVGGNSSESYCYQPSLNAILSLIRLFEKQERYKEVRQWYANLWMALKFHRQAAGVDGSIIFAVGEGYKKFLLLMKEDFSVVRLARDLYSMFQTDYGHLSLLTMKAAYELAVLLENSRDQYREAVNIFEEICLLRIETSPDKAEMLKIVQDARLHLAALYTKYDEYADKAERILIDTWVIARHNSGISHVDTRVCFTKIIEFYQKRDTGAALKSALLRMDEYIVEILTRETDEKQLFVMAQYIAGLYKSLKSVQTAKIVMKQIRAEFLGLQEKVGPKPRFGHSSAAFFDRRCFIFIMAVEHIVRDQLKDDLYAYIVELLFTEIALYEAWFKVSQGRHSLQIRFLAGVRLLKFLGDHNHYLESGALRTEIWEMYKKAIGGNLVNGYGAVRQLFELLVADLARKTISIAMVKVMAEACVELWQVPAFDGCLDLVRWIRTFFDPYGLLDRRELVQIGFRLAAIVTGRNRDRGDQSLASVREIRKIIFEIILVMLRLNGDGGLDFAGLKPEEINILIEALHGQNDLDAIENFFQALWDSRTFRNWSPQITIEFGKRLCWAKYKNNHQAQALELIEDICYNLTDTYGRTHKWTDECYRLQAQLLGSEGHYEQALEQHAQILQDTLDSPGLKDPEVLAGVQTHLYQLRAAYQLARGWGSRGRDYYASIVSRAGKETASGDPELIDISRWQIPDGAGTTNGVSGSQINGTNGDLVEIQQAQKLIHWEDPEDWTLPQEVLVEADGVMANGFDPDESGFEVHHI